MNTRVAPAIIIILLLSVTLTGSLMGMPEAEHSDAFLKLERDSVTPPEVVWSSQTGTPSFVRLNVTQQALGLHSSGQSSEKLALEAITEYGELFGIESAEEELVIIARDSDDLGIDHLRMQQVYDGLPVYGGEFFVHVDARSSAVIAFSSSFVPDIRVKSVVPTISASDAISRTKLALPGGTLVGVAQLNVLHDFTKSKSNLTWIIDLETDDATVANRYFVDAETGNFLGVDSLILDARKRETYDAENKKNIPGKLMRSEGDAAVGDADVDQVHDFAGETYDYYKNVHGRDSYNDKGATLKSIAHYDKNWRNAGWSPAKKLVVYGDGYGVRDVVGHEWTHGVIQYTAKLQYKWQSGALNESFADMFGMMIDRDDWIMGEDLPSFGRRRSIADPTLYGQPDHTSNWLSTCSDEEGVHTNSGITNKAFYNVATELGKEKAEKIFYRALVKYLGKRSSLEDARSATLQAAEDIHGKSDSEYSAVEKGFNAVGLNGKWKAPSNDCGNCAVTNLLADEGLFKEKMAALNTAATLYRLRDVRLSRSNQGQFYVDLYENHTARITALLALRPDLRGQGAGLLTTMAHGLDSLMNGNGSQEIVTVETVNNVKSFLVRLAEADRENGGGDLARDIELEMGKIDWDFVVGMTYDRAENYLLGRSYQVFIPELVRAGR